MQSLSASSHRGDYPARAAGCADHHPPPGYSECPSGWSQTSRDESQCCQHQQQTTRPQNATYMPKLFQIPYQLSSHLISLTTLYKGGTSVLPVYRHRTRLPGKWSDGPKVPPPILAELELEFVLPSCSSVPCTVALGTLPSAHVEDTMLGREIVLSDLGTKESGMYLYILKFIYFEELLSGWHCDKRFMSSISFYPQNNPMTTISIPWQVKELQLRDVK